MSTQAVGTIPLDTNDKQEVANHLARAVALHLSGKREEALRQLQRRTGFGRVVPRNGPYPV